MLAGSQFAYRLLKGGGRDNGRTQVCPVEKLFSIIAGHDRNLLAVEVFQRTNAGILSAHQNGAVHRQVGKGEIVVLFTLRGSPYQGEYLYSAIGKVLFDFAPGAHFKDNVFVHRLKRGA